MPNDQYGSVANEVDLVNARADGRCRVASNGKVQALGKWLSRLAGSAVRRSQDQVDMAVRQRVGKGNGPHFARD